MESKMTKSRESEIDSYIEEFTELEPKRIREFHPYLFEVTRHSTHPERKAVRHYFQASFTHQKLSNVWFQYRVRSQTHDYVPINLATSIKELSMDLADIKGHLEEINQKLAETSNIWTTQIRDLGDEGYKLLEPILVFMEEYPDDTIIARFPEIEVFGEGVTDSEAILNLKVSILDLYDELTETDFNTLGKLPKMWLRILDGIITTA